MSEERGPGRPEAIIDWHDVAVWISKGANGTECAARLGISYDTLSRRSRSDNNIDFAEFLQQNRAKGELTLREAQFNKAINGDSALLIWLGKVRLGQKEEKSNSEENKEVLDKMDMVSKQLSSLQTQSASKICNNNNMNE